MDKHTMHVLKDVTAHKEVIIQKVRQQIQQEPYPSKQLWPYRMMAIMMTCSILLFIAWQATKPIDHLTTEIPQEEKQSFTDLFHTEVEGKEITFSQYFQIADTLSHREKIKFYAPLQGFEAMQAVANTMGDAVHLIDPENLPFNSNVQEVYAVTSKMPDDSLQKQLQFSYKEKSLTGVDRQYIILTITNVNDNPLANYKVTEDIKGLSEEITNVGLNFMNPLYYRAMTPNKGFAYLYYNYDEVDKRIYRMSTRANEFYTYYNGYVYQIGYQLEGDQQEVKEKMVKIAREFIPHINER